MQASDPARATDQPAIPPGTGRPGGPRVAVGTARAGTDRTPAIAKRPGFESHRRQSSECRRQPSAKPAPVGARPRERNTALGQREPDSESGRPGLQPDYHDRADQDRQLGVSSGHIRRAPADRGRDQARDLLGRVCRAVLGGCSPLLQPGGHDPHLQRRAVRGIQPVSQRARPGRAVSAGRPHGHADDQRPRGRPGRRAGDAFPGQCAPVREHVLSECDERTGSVQ